FVDGADIQHLIQSGELSEESALDVVRQICEALHYAHGLGYIHRDIKPANILVTRDGLVKVGDFGLAKLTAATEEAAEISNLTAAGFVLGTPNYLAPESIENGQSADHRADIYSLGVMFYEMLTGSLPKGNFPPPSKKAKVDARLDKVVLKAMESEPDRRYQQASEVKTAVDKISPRGGQSGGNLRKRFGIYSAAAGLTVLAVIGFLIWNPAPEHTPNPEPNSAQVVPIPNRDLPERPARFRGHAFAIGFDQDGAPIEVTGLEDIDDFVEVQMQSDFGWVGLRENGDVWKWHSSEGASLYREGYDVATLNQGANAYRGAWLSTAGEIIPKGQDWIESEVFDDAPNSGVVDLCLSGRSERRYSLLKIDGNVASNLLGEPPPRFGDYVRVSVETNLGIGLREDGLLVFWGETPPPDAVETISEKRFVALEGGYAITDTGEVWKCHSAGIERKVEFDAAGQPIVKFVAGREVQAAQLAGGTWFAVGEAASFQIVEKINAFGPEVESLSFTRSALVWLEPGPRRGNSAPNRPQGPKLLTRDLPELRQLPKGKAKVWSSNEGDLALDDLAAIDDFVEVQLDSAQGWYGLRSNGDVVRWNQGTGVVTHREGMEVRTLGRTSDINYGEWLAAGGRLIDRNHRDNRLHQQLPDRGIVDLAKTYPDGEYVALSEDGKLLPLSSGVIPPAHLATRTDFARIEGVTRTIVGLTETGELHVWGDQLDQPMDWTAERFVKLASGTFGLLALSVDGAVWRTFSDSFVLDQDFADKGKIIDIACARGIRLARLENGRWIAATDMKDQGLVLATVDQINSLGLNAISIS
ncbi:MAG: serine/threonine-protein kinase, partial [Verrucomicrobiota bacterium]